MSKVENYINENKERFLKELFEFISIPSISSKTEHKDDMFKAAEYLKNQLIAAGAELAEVCTTDGNPVVFASKTISSELPTVLVYGHYDVMPAEPFEEWKSEPFKPELRDGRIWGRGADDDKGQSFIHVKAFEFLVQTQQLHCNIKFLIEGEEEVGSPSLGKWAATHKEKLKADIILVSDTSMLGVEVPSVTVGLRGLTYVEVCVTGPNRDLHSGLFGGAVANPINILSEMIAQLHDANNRITVKGFYDDVAELTATERTELNRAPFDIQEYKKSLDISEVWGEDGYTTLERTGIRPTLDVNGIWGGYTGEGSKTVLPSKAFAKISMRLVPHQDYMKIGKLFAEHFKSIAPPNVKVEVKILHGGQSYVCPTDIFEYSCAEQAYQSVFGIKPVPFRSGGSIPIISTLEEVLGLKSILMGFGLESDAIHGPNENFRLECFEKGIQTIVKFYELYAEKKK